MQPLRRVRWGWELRLPLWGAVSSHQTVHPVIPRSVGVLLNGLPVIFVHVASSTALSRSVLGGALCLLLLRLRCHPISICVAVLVLAFVVLLLRLAWLSLHSGVLEVAALFDVLVIFCPRGGGTDTQHIPIPPYPKNNAKRSDFHRDLLQRLRLFRRYGKIKRILPHPKTVAAQGFSSSSACFVGYAVALPRR